MPAMPSPDRLPIPAHRMPVVLALALGAAACGGPGTTADRPVPGSDFVRVVVEANEGHIDPEPAYDEAARQCGERLQRAVFFMAQPVGEEDRMFLFRCE